MTIREPRNRDQRVSDTRRQLTTPAVDAWVASAGADGSEPYLVPLSLAWIDERAVVALDVRSRTARNITAGGLARLGVGPTRDVVMIDVRLEGTFAVLEPEAAELAERFAAQADWDPRTAGPGYCFLVLRPERIQAWRESDEIAGRTLMRNEKWLADLPDECANSATIGQREGEFSMNDVPAAVAAECLRLADYLEMLSADQWNAQSLCEKWRVQDVVAHLTMPARYSPEQFGAEIAASGGDFTAMSDRVSARDGQLPPETLVAGLRSEVMRRFAPPGGYEGALNHLVIHGLDITKALGAEPICVQESLRTVLDQLVNGGGAANFGTDVSDMELIADDLEWSAGTGRKVSGPAADLALFICHRRLTLPGDTAPGRMARSVDDFYGEGSVPPPIGLKPTRA